ncbi:MAG: hypothetical protein HDS11_07330 [Bacteroides sp.]|nr:hypothetical protein [Bacteroides sp.]
MSVVKASPQLLEEMEMLEIFGGQSNNFTDLPNSSNKECYNFFGCGYNSKNCYNNCGTAPAD